jgi:hypothetical protein
MWLLKHADVPSEYGKTMVRQRCELASDCETTNPHSFLPLIYINATAESPLLDFPVPKESSQISNTVSASIQNKVPIP